MTMKYTIIKSKAQYKQYCIQLETLLEKGMKIKSKPIQDEIELLTLLIEKWDEEHNTFDEIDPIRLLEALMKDHSIKAKDLSELLGISKGLVSEILHYKKGLSKVSQEAFNREYKLEINKTTISKKTQTKTTGKTVVLV